ncbi:4-hydroxyphenylpyruvate dioxygenase [Streptomyces sp. DT2A-34]|uniref:4-hydroxyphenylpyruvate dioxygenase n=1 Tax=Streptomyces sp. DT2A-34 TaxID=3051182 RepID=UPI00265C4B0A|nr:4-hydroxyphenylpyruvate dioxygenase [Streptomyces sp. DT2A-34]MDO0915401.1 4-hydroxyphenylpyruvate dioxygenase [Streptomyces sp. DT2A-34]
MPPSAIAYAELYVTDDRDASGFLIDSLGFVPLAVAGPATGTHDRRSTVLRSGEVTLVVTQALQPGTAVARHVEEHGDSIADLAFSCDDVQSCFDRAVLAGATALQQPTPSLRRGQDTWFAAVSGFGDVRHTLIAATDDRAGQLPPDRDWALLPAATDPAAPRPVLDHVAVCLEAGTLRRTAEFYEAAFDMPFYSSEYIEVGDQAMDSIVVRNAEGGITFTLIEPDDTRLPGQINQFLNAHNGPGVQHLAFLVDDIVGSVRALGDRGVAFLRTPGAYYDLLTERVSDMADAIADLRETNVLADRDEWGYLLQIFTRSPYPRGTLFYEYIQRNGARGFGSSNIKALYEAVEREREVAGR